MLLLLSWILLTLGAASASLSLWNSASGNPKGLFDGLAPLLLTGGILCSAYSPQRTQDFSPKLKKFVIACFALVLVLTVSASILPLVLPDKPQTKEMALRYRQQKMKELDDEMNDLERDIKQFESKKPTESDTARLGMKMKRIKAKQAELNGKLPSSN